MAAKRNGDGTLVAEPAAEATAVSADMRGNQADGFLPLRPPRAPIPLAVRPDGYAVLPEGDACAGCDHCCRYVAMEIDKPTTKKDFDNIRWYLLHRSISILIDWDGAWLIQFDTPCEWLRDNRCTHYELRPEICREYDPKECERYLPSQPAKVIMKSEADLQKYLAEREVRLAARRKARAEREAAPTRKAAPKRKAAPTRKSGKRATAPVRAASRTGRAPSGR